MTLEELKRILLEEELEEFAKIHLLTPGAPAIQPYQIEFIAETITSKYRIRVSPDDLYIVGSAKIGYALFEKNYLVDMFYQGLGLLEPSPILTLQLYAPSYLMQYGWN